MDLKGVTPVSSLLKGIISWHSARGILRTQQPILVGIRGMLGLI